MGFSNIFLPGAGHVYAIQVTLIGIVNENRKENEIYDDADDFDVVILFSSVNDHGI